MVEVTKKRTQKNNQFLDAEIEGSFLQEPNQGKVCEGGGASKDTVPNRMVSHTCCAMLRGYIKNCSCLGTLRGLDILHARIRRLA